MHWLVQHLRGFRVGGEINKCKNFGIRRLMLGAIDALERGNKSLRVITHQYYGEYEARVLPGLCINRFPSPRAW